MRTGALQSTGDEATSHNPQIRKRVILRRGDVPAVTQIARTVFPPGEMVAEHSHADMWEIFLCEQGIGSLRVDGQVVRLEPGVWVEISPGEIHDLKAGPDGHLVLTTIGVARGVES